jgi:hypothetical protein
MTEMIEHGIFTTKADFWIHFFPLEPAVYYYKVSDCLEYIRTRNLAPIDARSKNGQVTGRGYLVPKSAPFLKHRRLDPGRVAHINWNTLTDREFGFYIGPALVIEWLRNGIFHEFTGEIKVLESKDDQFSGRDISFGNGKGSADIKCERPVTINLFVQDQELNHDPNRSVDGTIKQQSLPEFLENMTLTQVQERLRRGGDDPAMRQRLWKRFDSLVAANSATTASLDLSPPEQRAPGFVGYSKDGHFVHYCHCGKEASFGYGVSVRQGQFGKWYCREHRPVGDLTAPSPALLPPPPAPEPKVPAAVGDDDREDRDLQMLLDL